MAIQTLSSAPITPIGGLPTLNAGTATVTVTRTGGNCGAVSVQYATSNGTATAGQDYTTKANTLNWAAGDAANKIFTVAITNDTTKENDETINLTLSNPTGGATLGAQATATITIADDDNPGQLQFSAANYDVNEGTGTATITVTRTNGTSGEVKVDYATSDGTAQSTSDYASKTGTLTFANGVSNQTFTVSITNDTLPEPDEIINLTLTNPTNQATLGAQDTATITIIDNDKPGVVQFQKAAYTAYENSGTVTFTVTRTGGSAGAISVQWATGGGTATAGQDYTAANGTLNWATGDAANKIFTVTVLNDAIAEPDEMVNLTLSNPTGGATLGSINPAVLTIRNGEAPVNVPTLSEWGLIIMSLLLAMTSIYYIRRRSQA